MCSLIHLHSWKSLDCLRRQEPRTGTTHFWMTSRTLNSILVSQHTTLNRQSSLSLAATFALQYLFENVAKFIIWSRFSEHLEYRKWEVGFAFEISLSWQTFRILYYSLWGETGWGSTNQIKRLPCLPGQGKANSLVIHMR